MIGPRTSLRLRVVPGASRTGIVGRHGDAWKVCVTAAPRAGQANEALLQLLARTLDVPRRDLRLRHGLASRDKLVELDGLTREAAEGLLAAAAERKP